VRSHVRTLIEGEKSVKRQLLKSVINYKLLFYFSDSESVVLKSVDRL